MSGKQLQEDYAFMLEGQRTGMVREMIRQTGIAPAESLVQKAYENYVIGRAPDFRQKQDYSSNPNKYTLGLVRDLEDMTGIKPKLSNTLVQSVYRQLLDPAENFVMTGREKFSPETSDVETMLELYKMTGVEPKQPKGLVRRAYGVCMRKERMDLFEELRSIIKTEPDYAMKQELDTHYKPSGQK